MGVTNMALKQILPCKRGQQAVRTSIGARAGAQRPLRCGAVAAALFISLRWGLFWLAGNRWLRSAPKFLVACTLLVFLSVYAGELSKWSGRMGTAYCTHTAVLFSSATILL